MTAHARARRSRPLDGLRILVVEDEALVSLLIEDMLLELGCDGVWHATSLNQALEMLDTRNPDAAVLDVNLTGERVYPIASRLESAGIPFIFATGYGRGGIDKEWLSRPVLQKPFESGALEAALASVLVRSSDCGRGNHPEEDGGASKIGPQLGPTIPSGAAPDADHHQQIVGKRQEENGK